MASRVGRKRERSESRGVSIMSRAASTLSANAGGMSNLSKRARASSVVATSRMRDRSVMGINSDKQKAITEKIKKNFQRPAAFLAKAGEADRTIQIKMPKHLFAGKRGGGSTDRRVSRGVEYFGWEK